MKPQTDSSRERRQNMNWDKACNNWEAFRQDVKAHWQWLSDKQLDRIRGRRERLLDELQRTYALSPNEAETEIQDFETGSSDSLIADSGRGPTERVRELGTGNNQGGRPRSDRHELR